MPSRDETDRPLGPLVAARWLALPICLLLFLQWPLRDIVRAYSREANDLAQWLFALYVGCAVTAATRARAHLAADTLARRYAPGWRIAIWRAASLWVLLPWAGFVLLTATPVVWQSVVQFERFSDTGNPFYFVIKISAWLMALFMGLQALHDVFGRR